MKSSLFYLSVAALTFLAGLSAYKLWHTPTHSTNISEPLKVSFCDLERDSKQYDGKMVWVRAVLYRDGKDPFIYDWSCGPPDANSTPLIRVSNDTNNVLPEWASGDVFCAHDVHAKDEELGADVIVVGIFESHYFAPYDSPNAKHFRIIPHSVYQLSSPSKQRSDGRQVIQAVHD
jgi:hypothetical protein